MKFGVIANTSYKTLIEHCRDTSLGITENLDGIIVEDHYQETPPDLPSLNTSPIIRKFYHNPALWEDFKKINNVKEGYPITYLYGFISKSGLANMIEVAYSTRFMTGDIGPQVGFVQGTAVRVDDYYEALLNLRAIVEVLTELGYSGEIAFGILPSFEVCDIIFGHNPGFFSLYAELLNTNPTEMFTWCLSPNTPCSKVFSNSIAVTTMLSTPPYPHNLDGISYINAPSGAEKHLYRVQYGRAEIAYSAAWGLSIFEAKRRCRATIDNCSAYNKDLQYRIDYGYKSKFLLGQEKYISLGGSE